MIHWTKNACKKDALQYERRGQWSKLSHSAYSSAARNGWLNECCLHMPIPKTTRKGKPRKWHFDACMKDAKRFNHRSHWSTQSNSAYNSAKNNGWLEQCCAHMILLKGGRTNRRTISQYWDFVSCLKEARKYTSVSVWQAKNGSSYQAALRNKWIDKCTEHMYPNSEKHA
jgi:hypothetical protein